MRIRNFKQMLFTKIAIAKPMSSWQQYYAYLDTPQCVRLFGRGTVVHIMRSMRSGDPSSRTLSFNYGK